jgi:hypothetical protein
MSKREGGGGALSWQPETNDGVFRRKGEAFFIIIIIILMKARKYSYAS